MELKLTLEQIVNRLREFYTVNYLDEVHGYAKDLAEAEVIYALELGVRITSAYLDKQYSSWLSKFYTTLYTTAVQLLHKPDVEIGLNPIRLQYPYTKFLKYVFEKYGRPTFDLSNDDYEEKEE